MKLKSNIAVLVSTLTLSTACATSSAERETADHAACVAQDHLLAAGYPAAAYSERLFGVGRNEQGFAVIYRVQGAPLFNCVDVSSDMQSVYVHEANCRVRGRVVRLSARALDCDQQR